MIDFIKYFPLKLRQPDRNEDVKGPEFSSSKDIEIQLTGNRLKFKSPRHQPEFDHHQTYEKNPDAINGQFKSITNTQADDTWVSQIIFFRGFGYRYPWFGGYKGQLTFVVTITKRHDKYKFKDFSFLNPKGFEYAITNYLNTIYGKQEQNGKPDNIAPVDWKSHSHLPVVSASFYINPESGSLVFVFPITHEHFIKMDFAYYGAGDKLHSQMNTLAKQIIDSVTLELGPETQAMLNEVKAQCPDMTLTNDFPPLKWPVKKEDIENVPTINTEPPAPDLFG